MMRSVARYGIKVLLCGQGGDELFGGYNWYPKYLLVSLLLAGKWPAFLREINRLPSGFPNANTRHAGALLAGLVHGLLPSALKCRIKPEILGLERILKPRWRKAMRSSDPVNLQAVDPRGLGAKMRHDLLQNNVPLYLHYEDANSMAFGLEERAPFLDYRLVEWANRLPLGWRIREGTSKYALRLGHCGSIAVLRSLSGGTKPGCRPRGTNGCVSV